VQGNVLARVAAGKIATPPAPVVDARKPGNSPSPAAASFVYGGKTGMTVVGPVSGRIYRFERPGAQVNVDSRDRFLLASIPQLMLVK
jgi:hypothetical protein